MAEAGLLVPIIVHFGFSGSESKRPISLGYIVAPVRLSPTIMSRNSRPSPAFFGAMCSMVLPLSSTVPLPVLHCDFQGMIPLLTRLLVWTSQRFVIAAADIALNLETIALGDAP